MFKGVKLIGAEETLKDVSAQALVNALLAKCDHLIVCGKLTGGTDASIVQTFKGMPILLQGMAVELVRVIQDNVRKPEGGHNGQGE